MRQRSAQISLAVVCFLLGIALVVQFRTQSRVESNVLGLTVTEQWSIASNLTEANNKLRREVDELRHQLLEYESSVGKSELDRMVTDVNRLRIVNGASEVSGPGVELTLSGQLRADGSVAPEDLGDLVNELRDAGAEGIAVNGIRVALGSSFARAEGGVLVNGDRLISAPYVVEGLGNAEALERALTRQGGLVGSLRVMYPGATITVYLKPNVVLPRADHSLTFKLAQPVE
ncbi:MAG: DUF881 domain-containing protein [Chloroflexota bacterium]